MKKDIENQYLARRAMELCTNKIGHADNRHDRNNSRNKARYNTYANWEHSVSTRKHVGNTNFNTNNDTHMRSKCIEFINSRSNNRASILVM